MSRYSNTREPVDFSGFMSSTSAPEETGEQKKAQKDAEFMKFIGDIAPGLGTAVGGIAGGIGGGLLTAGNPLGIAAGASMGGAAGGGLGQAAQAGLGGLAANAQKPREEQLKAEQDKQDRRRELINVLMGMRR